MGLNNRISSNKKSKPIISPNKHHKMLKSNMRLKKSSCSINTLNIRWINLGSQSSLSSRNSYNIRSSKRKRGLNLKNSLNNRSSLNIKSSLSNRSSLNIKSSSRK